MLRQKPTLYLKQPTLYFNEFLHRIQYKAQVLPLNIIKCALSPNELEVHTNADLKT